MARIHGIFGKPYAILDYLVDPATLQTVDQEIIAGLPHAQVGQTGATLKWMGVVAPWRMNDGFRDAMDAIRAMSAADFEEFIQLGEYPGGVIACDTVFGDETDYPFSATQITFLTERHCVYFPWKVCVHLLENHRWEDKHLGFGKAFTESALRLFPNTVELVRSLPFCEIGRVVLFGLQPNDHAPLHRDSEPGVSLSIAQSISIDPRGAKGLFLQNSEDEAGVVLGANLYWFNDMDYHGVAPAPYFRYSIRIDGVFTPSFVRDLERRMRSA